MVLSYRSFNERLSYLPGYRVMFSPSSPLHFLLPSLPYISLGENRAFMDKHSCKCETPQESCHLNDSSRFCKVWIGCDFTGLYTSIYHFELQTNTRVQVYAIPTPRVDITIADADVIKVCASSTFNSQSLAAHLILFSYFKEVTSSRSRFLKPVHLYKVLTLYGSNIVASEGEDWKKTRKVAAPAFSEVCMLLPFPPFSNNLGAKRNNRLVWDESVRVIDSLHNEVWKDQDVISIDHFAEITAQV